MADFLAELAEFEPQVGEVPPPSNTPASQQRIPLSLLQVGEALELIPLNTNNNNNNKPSDQQKIINCTAVSY